MEVSKINQFLRKFKANRIPGELPYLKLTSPVTDTHTHTHTRYTHDEFSQYFVFYAQLQTNVTFEESLLVYLFVSFIFVFFKCSIRDFLTEIFTMELGTFLSTFLGVKNATNFARSVCFKKISTP